MNQFLPSEPAVLLFNLLVVTAVVATGYCLTTIRRQPVARALSWLTVAASVPSCHWICADEPAGYRMFVLIVTLLCGMKTVVAVESQGSGQDSPGVICWLIFCLGWLGMRIEVFRDLGRCCRCDWLDYVKKGCVRLFAGILFCCGAYFLSRLPADSIAPQPRKMLVTLMLFAGFSLVIHFGLINLAAGFWRRSGADCRSMFRAPLESYSLREFWGRRWNLGFSEMTSLGVYRPLRPHLGRQGATFVSFLFSGALHELAITVPVMACFGFPLCYFALHGGGMLVETQLERRGFRFEDHRVFARIWTGGWLILPLPVLFPEPFLREILWPMIEWYPA